MDLRKLFILANIIIGALILWVGTNITLTWLSNKDKKYPAPVRETIKKAPYEKINKNGKQEISFQPVIAKNIFKTVKAKPKPEKMEKKEEEKEEIQITDLNLKLQGTVLGENHSSFAVIEDGKTRKQDIYYLNDSIQGAKIAKITSDKVILNLDGKEEALVMSYERGAAPKKSRISKRKKPRRRITKRPTPRRKPKTRTRRTTRPITPPKEVDAD